MITVSAVGLEDADARALWASQQAELSERYGEPDQDHDFVENLGAGDLVVSLLARTSAGQAVGTALARWSPYHPGIGTVEVKRLFVDRGHRGLGYARVIMGAVERAAWRVGATRIALETGNEQPEALAVYRGIGYNETDPYGPYLGDPRSVCFIKEIPTRVLVLNGTMGAGKTAALGAIQDLLGTAGARVAAIDADWLCQAEPAQPDDRFNEDLMFDNLAAVAPQYRRRGYGLMVLARPIEDLEGRARYARSFADAVAGPGQVAVVRLEADEATRQRRLREREPAAFYEDFARHRTVELAESIVDADVDDAAVDNDDRDIYEVAREVLAAADWWAPGLSPLI